MAPDDRLERRLRGPRGMCRPVVPLQETIEQFHVGQPLALPTEKSVLRCRASLILRSSNLAS